MTILGQISWILPSLTSDDVYIKLSVTNQLSKICNMHFEILFSEHLKLHEQPMTSGTSKPGVWINRQCYHQRDVSCSSCPVHLMGISKGPFRKQWGRWRLLRRGTHILPFIGGGHPHLVNFPRGGVIPKFCQLVIIKKTDIAQIRPYGIHIYI